MVERNPSRLFCFGLGYTALALAEALAAPGFRIAGTTRAMAKAERLAGLGIDVSIFDGAVPLATEALAGTTHLLASVPADTGGDPVLRHHRAAAERLAASDPPWDGWGISPPPGSMATAAVIGSMKAPPLSRHRRGHAAAPRRNASGWNLATRRAWAFTSFAWPGRRAVPRVPAAPGDLA